MKKRLPPPKYFNRLVVLAILLHFIWPVKRVIHAPLTYLGLGFILLGVWLNIWSTKLLREQKTTTSINEKPNNLVVTGPFSMSRNPIYLSGIILLVGIATLLGSLTPFLLPLALLLILDRLYIPSEEKFLEELFGQAYLDYKKKVRKWI